jgi:lambda family phage tail tape measure protein
MAENQVNINLSLLDQQSTIKKRTAEIENLNNQLGKTQGLAGSAFTTATGTRAGAQALRATEAPDSTVRLQRTTITTGLQDSTRDQTNPQARRSAYGSSPRMMEDYTTAGGVSGRGGASARDFAAEAQGLGGLVRLYATYAANVFAVSAAFTALREAMNTDIMIRGMEQLGAATGQSLVSMSKSFVTATDGMVSFREAAEAVTKASSAGLGRDQILAVAEVAKGASQALGVNMSDAVSRLSRGIVKLEPELLDELGLFTKTGKAAEDYARKVGKTESQLTDFERRQAFANAVLEEGRKKFGEIAQEGNPYDKLLAELKNTAQDILSVVNTVVGPIAKVLADNTGLIGAAIALAAVKITQQAIPALGNWQKTLTASAERAKANLEDIGTAFQENLVTKAQQKAGLPELEKQLETAKRELAGMGGKGFRTSGYDPDNQRIRTAREIETEEAKINNQLNRGNDLQKQKAMKAQAVLDIEKRILDIQTKINIAHDLTQDKMDKEAAILSRTWQIEQNVRKARAEYAGAKAREQVSKDVYGEGVTGAISNLVRTVRNDKDMTTVAKGATIALGSVQALAQGFGILFNAVSRFFGYVGVAYAVFEVFDSMLSTNSKSASKLKDSIEQLEDVTKTAVDTNKKWEGSLGIEAAIAYANSLDAITSSVRNSIKAFNEFRAESSGWDKAIEWLKDVTPFVDSMQEKLAKQLGKSVVASIESLPVGPAREAFKQQYAQILNIPVSQLTPKNISRAVELGGPDKMAEVDSTLEQVNKRIQESSVYLKGLKDSGDLAEKSMTSFMNSMKDSSPMTTFFVNAIKYSGELNKALSDDSFTTIAAGLDKLSTTDLSLFGTAGLDIQKLVLEFNNLKPAYESAAKQLEGFRDKLAELREKRASKNLTNAGKRELDAQIVEQQGIISAQEQSVERIRVEIQSLGQEAERFIKVSIGQQVENVLEQFRLKLAQIQLQSQRDIVSRGFGDTVAGTQAISDISKQQIDVELKLVTSQDRLADRIDLLRLEIADAKDREALKAATTGEGFGQTTQKIEASMRARDLQKQFLETGGKFSTEKQQKDFEAEIARLQKIIPDNPALIAILERKTKMATAAASAEAKKLAVDFDTAIKTLDIEAKRQTDQLKFEFDKLNNVISTIGSDTPERLGTQLGLVQTILQEQYKLIDQTADAALKRAQTARDMALKAGQSPTQVAKQFDEKTGQIELERSRSKELLAQKTALEQIGKQEQYNLQVVERSFDLYMRLADAYKSLITGTSVGAERARAAADQQARTARDTLQSFREQSTLRREQATLDIYQAGLTQKYGGEEAAAREMTASERLTLQGLQENVDETKKWNEESSRVRGQISGIADKLGEYNVTTKEIQVTNAETLATLDQIKNIEDSRFETKNHELELEKQRFDILTGIGMYTQDEKNRLNANLQIKQIELQVERDLASITAERTRLEIALNDARRAAAGASMEEKSRDPQVIAAEQALANLDARQQLTIQRAQNAKELVERSVMVPDRFKNFANQFEKMFEGMADAVVDWATTGKGAFKDVINSFLQDILRYEMRLQMHAIYVQGLKPLLGNLFSNLFGGGTPIAAQGGGAMAMGGAFDAGIRKYAMGGAMDYTKEYSIPGYAKGGMFTNQIVNKPTLFKAAKGLGVMGEAGPEAIMPLSRMSNGELGVRMENGSRTTTEAAKPVVNFNVHNYSGQQVTTQETTDSRGNVSIDIMVGEMVGREIARPGGAPRQAIANSFGLQPTLIRR